MSFTLINGTFHVRGYCPDGDSIRFKALNPASWDKLFGPPVGLNRHGHAQLRMEAIDALETHFSGFHQPLRPGRRARNALLSSIGIDDVVWNSTQSEVLYAEDCSEGHILTRTTEKNRRPVAFVFAGHGGEEDGADVFLDSGLLRKSINYRLMSKGLVYPTYYNGLFSELREEFTRAMKEAKYDGLGIWQHDKTTSGFSADLDTLTTDSIIMPKLFRRIVEYTSAGKDACGFMDFLAANCEPLVKIPQVHFTRLETVVEVEDGRIRLMQAPEDLVFLDKVLCKKRYQTTPA